MTSFHNDKRLSTQISQQNPNILPIITTDHSIFVQNTFKRTITEQIQHRAASETSKSTINTILSLKPHNLTEIIPDQHNFSTKHLQTCNNRTNSTPSSFQNM
ncbi:hypothetical protein Hanom_Chr07g00591481 [Helianthus anomalus]